MVSNMVALTKLRDLELSRTSSAGRPLHLSAASGLVRLGDYLYVIADDEHHLGVFREGEAGELIRLFEGELSDDKKTRKKQKPDLEALTLLPAFGTYAHGALLALGSGSKDNRTRGALLGLDAQGAVQDVPRIIEFSDFLAPLDDVFSALNIEGAVVSRGELRLFQRGNKKDSGNAIIRFPLVMFLSGLSSERMMAIAPLGIDWLDLGEIDGIPFCFTDAAGLPDGGMVFSAVAENTDNTYEDGPCVGAAIGLLGNDGTLQRMHRLKQPHKVEGVDARQEGDVIKLLLVTDGDDAAQPASLFSAELG